MRRIAIGLTGAVAAGAVGALAFNADDSDNAYATIDDQLRATATTLLRPVAEPSFWADFSFSNNTFRRLLDRYAGQLYTRKQFAVICWGSRIMRGLVPLCVHASEDQGEGIALDSSPPLNQVEQPMSVIVTFRGYITPVPIPETVEEKTGISAALYVYQAVE